MYTKTVETWNTRYGKIAKIAVRDKYGRFHGSTNFRQVSNWTVTVLGTTSK